MSVNSVKGENELPNSTAVQPNVYLGVLFALGVSHLLNDTVQSLVPAV